MRRLFAVLLGGMLGGGLVYTAFEYHVVRTDDQFLFIPKRQAGLEDPYVDIRKWPAAEWKNHPVLTQNLIADGKGNLVGGSIAGGLLEEFVAPFVKESSESGRRWWQPEQD